MRYYTLKEAEISELETGYVYPQISSDSPCLTEGKKNSIRNLDAYMFPNFVPDLNYYELSEGAKLTDLLSGGVPAGINGGIVCGFVMSEKLKKIIERHNTAPVVFYPATVKEGKKFHTDYYFMQMVSDLSDKIDFKKSKFYIEKFTENKGEIRLESKTDYKAKLDTLQKESLLLNIEPESLVMKNSFDSSLDMFVVGYIDFNINISERLRTEIIMAGITGIEIKESVVKLYKYYF